MAVMGALLVKFSASRREYLCVACVAGSNSRSLVGGGYSYSYLFLAFSLCN